MENRKEGGIRIGTSGNQSAINIIRAAAGEIVGNLDSDEYQEAEKRIIGEIPDPAFGYMRGIPTWYRGKGDASRANLIDWILSLYCT